MEETKNPDSHLTSASAFVEGGIQDACDDSCSICLEEFSDRDPSTVTCCKHEFHLQCILEWCQRSSQCPMCWQDIHLKDPTSQELLEAVEHERKLRAAPPRNSAIFHHPAFGDFQLHNLPIGTDDELEERIIQQLAAAAAMGRVRHVSRREGQRHGPSSHGRRHYLVFSPHQGASTDVTEGGSETLPIPSPPMSQRTEGTPRRILPSPQAQSHQNSVFASGSSSPPMYGRGLSSNNRNASGSSSALNQNQEGPLDLQSFSESLKSRFNTLSTRYKESISRNARGWKERLFSRTNSMYETASEAHQGANVGNPSMSRLENRETGPEASGSNHNTTEELGDDNVNGPRPVPRAAGSVPI